MKIIDEKKLDECLKKKFEKLKVSGVSVAIRGPEGYSFERGYGYRDLKRSITPDGNTIFGIASMGKSMAALGAAILAAEGKLTWTTRFPDIFRIFQYLEIRRRVLPSGILPCTQPESRRWSRLSGRSV